MFILCAWYMEVRGQLGVESFHMVFWVLGCTGLSLTLDSFPKFFLSSVGAGELWIMLLILSYANLQALL